MTKFTELRLSCEDIAREVGTDRGGAENLMAGHEPLAYSEDNQPLYSIAQIVRATLRIPPPASKD